ncbi:hypothetical protein Efla_000531 [Eimeria flavescens]
MIAQASRLGLAKPVPLRKLVHPQEGQAPPAAVMSEEINAECVNKCSGARWRQEIFAIASKQRHYCSKLKHLRSELNYLREQGQKDISRLKQQDDTVENSFPDLFVELKLLLQQYASNEKVKRQLTFKLKSLKYTLDASEERVRQVGKELDDATNFKVTHRPTKTFGLLASTLQAR